MVSTMDRTTTVASIVNKNSHSFRLNTEVRQSPRKITEVKPAQLEAIKQFVYVTTDQENKNSDCANKHS